MIPEHLKPYIVEQDYSRYTSIDQASWRYLLRQLRAFFSQHAHECYLDGLEKTGISVERIPSIAEISAKIEKFGWTAHPVSGFIPPAAFMELQAHSILPIASDMRSIDHLMYTPAPDIVHEAAGHAPILVNHEFASYLKSYASVAKKAIISKEDLTVYEAIRVLSDIKEDPDSTSTEIENAEKNLTRVLSSVTYTSEASLLSRMNWWTAEYGLIGDINSPKIFGAGLLSSLGESRDCLLPKVKKIPLSLECLKYSYDITEPQPQLFVTPDFATLNKVLDEMAKTMSYQKGGLSSLKELIRAKTENTAELNSGLQISGLFVEVLEDQGQPIYLKLSGPSQLCFENKVILGQGISQHPQGFGTPLGRIQGLDEKCPSTFNASDLQKLGLEPGKRTTLEFTTGVKVTGHFNSGISMGGRWLVFSFENATVTYKDQTLFLPEWGTFDMAVGTDVVSSYGGVADRIDFGSTESFKVKKVPAKKYSEEQLKIQRLYSEIRTTREKNLQGEALEKSISQVVSALKSLPGQEQSNQWLLWIELYELCKHRSVNPNLSDAITSWLESSIKNSPEIAQPIKAGIDLAGTL